MRQEFQRPAWMTDWKIFLVFSLVSFAIAFGLRCIDLPKWDNPLFFANGEVIQGTHDAYFWLAGAKGVGSAVGNPMSTILIFLGDITGQQLGNISFWLPAVFAGFCAVAAFGWGMFLAGPWAGLVVAVYTTSIPAYFFRTRLAYYDTDIITLLFPLLISLFMALWIRQGTRLTWLSAEKGTSFQPTFWDYLLPIIAGCISSYGELWHSDVQVFGVAVALCSVFLVIVCGNKKDRVLLMQGTLLFSLPAFFGIYGLIGSILFLYVLFKGLLQDNKVAESLYTYLVLFILIFILSGAGDSLFMAVWSKISAYAKPVSGTASIGVGPSYPGIAQSVIEAQNISIDHFFANLAGSEMLGWLGFLSFFVCLMISPLALYLLPFTLAALSAVVLGGRFAMFGGVTMGVGLGFLLNWAGMKFLEGKEYKKSFIVAASVIISLTLLIKNYDLYNRTPVTPIIYQQHAEGLIQSGKVMPEGSTVWTWWDWGYASMYYTGQNSFANGGNHAGPVLYPLALAYTTPSFLQSNQFIKYCAVNGNNPADAWASLSAKEVMNLLGALGSKKFDFPTNNKQYIVVSWKDVTLAHWILYYGAWDVEQASSFHPNFGTLYSGFSIDDKEGVMIETDGVNTSLASYDVLENGRVASRVFPDNVGPHLIFNAAVNQGFLVGDFSYASLLVQLMTANPESSAIKPYFKLLYEGAPYVRIYEVI